MALLMLAMIGPPALADHGKVHRHVTKRIESMQEQAVAMETLGAMTSGQTPYDRRRARQMKSILARETRRTDNLFRSDRDDPHSHARRDIWSNWDGFKHMTKTAQRAVRGLETRSREQLMRTLPAVLGQCHSCHARFRKPD